MVVMLILLHGPGQAGGGIVFLPPSTWPSPAADRAASWVCVCSPDVVSAACPIALLPEAKPA